ncbi:MULTISPECIES: response regulator [unclassified Spirillospora]|uniref:response regulator n=1 Tax=unclassified Spirillospora TaxID=2642701 RepID=UPI00371A1AF0
MTSATTRILIADDQADVRSGLRLVLDAQPDMTVVGEAADGAAAIGMARHLRPDIVFADIRMPRVDGLEVTRRLSGPQVSDPIRVIVMTVFDLDDYVTRALHNGACGFLLKRSGPMLLIEAARAAMAGDTMISPQITVRLLRRLTPPPAATRSDAGVLTPRELDIARGVAHAKTNAEIAGDLFISPGTVKTHIASIQAKLNARNRVGIAAWVWATGHVEPGGLHGKERQTR